MSATLTNDDRAVRFRERQAGDLYETDWESRRAAQLAVDNRRLAAWAVGRFVPCPLAPEEYEDCRQEAAAAIVRACRMFDPRRVSEKTGQPVRISTYLSRSCLNAIDQWRTINSRHGFGHVGDTVKGEGVEPRRARKPVRIDLQRVSQHGDEYQGGFLEGLHDSRPAPPDAAEANDEVGRLRDALDRLARGPDGRLAAVVRGVYLEGKSLREVGQEIRLSRESVRQMLARGMAELQRAMGVPEGTPVVPHERGRKLKGVA